ncbi:MAG: phytanoyl-CoA dioxygenase family protein [Armatimonadaceae bacterium]
MVLFCRGLALAQELRATVVEPAPMQPLANPLVPAADDLSVIERELCFVPTANPSPKVLTTHEIDRYNRDGHLGPFRILSDSEATALRTFFDGILAEALARGESSYSIASAHRRFAPVWDLLHHPAIVDRVADLLGDDIVAWGSHFFCKLPGDGKIVDWHQDAVYWPMTPSKTVTVWLAVDDTDTENACMRFIPRSHRHGPLTHLPSSAADDNVLNLKVTNPLSFGKAPFDDVLRAGEASFHSDLLLHGSDANQSDRRRCGITLRYCAASVRAYLGWNEKGMVVRGSDPEGHWANPKRPAD